MRLLTMPRNHNNYVSMKFNGIINNFPYRITGFLGSGQFGNVDRGMMRTAQGMYVEVAIKTLAAVPADGSLVANTHMDKVRFLQEAAIMAQFKHPNVVKLYGVSKEGETVSAKSISL